MFDVSILIAQMLVVLVVARIMGWLFRAMRQPQVVGEMVAGLILGPSLLGWIAPGISAALFPPDGLDFLNTLSHIGVLLFMFLVGLEFNPQLLHGRSRAVVLLSQTSVILPFLLGLGLAMVLYPRLSDPAVPFANFALFMGLAISITAFPVLARILTERNMLCSPLGTITITCAAVDDVTGWFLLGGIVLLARAGEEALPWWTTLFGIAAYIGIMISGVRRLLQRLLSWYRRRNTITQDMLGIILLLVFASSFITEYLGIHALFGAFIVGAVMPHDRAFVAELNEKIEGLVLVLLLPLFFAFTGLRTSLGLLNEPQLWLYCVLILAVAIIGKWAGATIVGRLTGLSWRDAGALGVLMNTRGLMELVVLNIGLDIGVIPPTLFTMMVLMAVATTFMTTPLLELLYPEHTHKQTTNAFPLSRGLDR